ncbi:MAG: hypothetical protein KGL62_10040 [Bradyrhizobium sp.]|uniref:hypothetical protein n=1 Tax=Bradyrhizobium sp. TaxID=376 RepID=UPI0023842085|nr:hypothetical protein [Bradyrhizobium sp.]MDE2602692.1 hypothetical protein [Bradyrhizobium sp.]
MRKLLMIAAVGLSLGGCAQLQTALSEARSVYTYATTKTVASGQAAIVANAYDTLKATAVNYGNYCITQRFPKPVCSASNRRAVIKAVRAGDAARAQIEAPITTGQPVAATLYNTLVAVIQQLQAAPINVAKGQ